MRSFLGKKGLTLQDMASIGLVFVLLGVILSMGAYINGQIQTTAGWDSTTTAYRAVQNATVGIAQLASWLPIIAIVVAAGIVIGVLVQSFRGGGV